MFLVKAAIAAIWPATPSVTPKQEYPKIPLVRTVRFQDEDEPHVMKVFKRVDPTATLINMYFVKDSEGNAIPLRDILQEIDEDKDSKDSKDDLEDDEEWFIGESMPRSKPMRIPPLPKDARGWDDDAW